MGGFIKRGVRNKTAEKRLKLAIFKLLVLSYMHTTLYFSFVYSNNIKKLYVVWKYKKKFESTNMVLTHLLILIFFRLFMLGGRVAKCVEKNDIHLKMKIYVCFRSNIVLRKHL